MKKAEAKHGMKVCRRIDQESLDAGGALVPIGCCNFHDCKVSHVVYSVLHLINGNINDMPASLPHKLAP